MRRFVHLSVILLALAGASCVWLFRFDISLSKSLDLSGTFLDTAALVFAIIGAWLALFFPDYFAKLFSKDQLPVVTDEANSANLRVLLGSLLLSGVVIVLNLTVAFFATYREVILQYFGLAAARTILLFSVYVSFLALVYCLLSAIAPAAEVLVRDKLHVRTKERMERLQGKSIK